MRGSPSGRDSMRAVGCPVVRLRQRPSRSSAAGTRPVARGQRSPAAARWSTSLKFWSDQTRPSGPSGRACSTEKAASSLSKRSHSQGTGSRSSRCATATALVPPCATTTRFGVGSPCQTVKSCSRFGAQSVAPEQVAERRRHARVEVAEALGARPALPVLRERALRGLDEVAVDVFLREPLERDADLGEAVQHDGRLAGLLRQRVRGLSRAPVRAHVDRVDALLRKPLGRGARLRAAEGRQRRVVDRGSAAGAPVGLAVAEQRHARVRRATSARLALGLHAGLRLRLDHVHPTTGRRRKVAKP